MFKKYKKRAWEGGENPPWIEKLRLHVLVCEEVAEEGSRRMWMKLYQTGPHMHISYYRLSKFYEHLVLAPKSFQLRDFFFYFFFLSIYLSLTTSRICYNSSPPPRGWLCTDRPTWTWAPAWLHVRHINHVWHGVAVHVFYFPRENLFRSVSVT